MNEDEKKVALIGRPDKAGIQLAAMSMLEAGLGGLATEEDESEYVRHDDRSDFVKHHDELDKLRRRGFRIAHGKTYVKPKT